MYEQEQQGELKNLDPKEVIQRSNGNEDKMNEATVRNDEDQETNDKTEEERNEDE